METMETMETMEIERIPVKGIRRVPIIETNEVYQIIASHNKEYTPCEVIETYPDLYSAKDNYLDGIDKAKALGKGYKHFAIKKVIEDDETRNG